MAIFQKRLQKYYKEGKFKGAMAFYSIIKFENFPGKFNKKKKLIFFI
jgi:hypothetical protein